MSEPAGNLVWLSHPRLASMAVSALPAWLWSADATRLIWANPTGAAIFDTPVSAAIRASTFGSRGPAAIQVARLAASLRPDGAALTERLRGLGAGVGGVLTCACSCITLSDQTRAILVAATERAGDELPLTERVRRLLAQCGAPIAAFSCAGKLIHASVAARIRLAGATSLAALGAQAHAETAQRSGSATGPSTAGPLAIERIDTEAASILIVIFGEAATRTPSGVAVTSLPPPADSAAAGAGRRVPLRFVWQMDAQERLTISSDEFAALTGEATVAALGRPWEELAAELSLDPAGQIARALASRDTWSGLSVAWPVDDGGERLTVELSGLPVFDRERNFRGYRGFGICRDVARLAALAASRRAAPLATVAAIEPGANVVPLHPAAGRPAAPTLSPVERSAFQELTRTLHERLAATGSTTLLPADYVHSNLAEAIQEPAHQELAPQELATQEPATQEPAAQELAHQEPAAPEPQREHVPDPTALNRQPDLATAARADFLAKISHEIRTPLNAIIGFSEIMAQEKFGPVGNERYRQYLLDIRSSGTHLLSLVNDLLDLSRIEAGKLELNFAPVALNPLAQECVASLQPQANRERVLIRTALSPRLPPVTADARSLRQIVRNLLANSTRFAGAGGQVIVSTTLTDLGEVVLRVRESGSGMSEQDIALALAPFRQVATAVGRGPGGNLGLPLAKALAEANRATFRIRSEPNVGTLIEVTFPPERVVAKERR
jgi:signal transduction histidine kinase